MNSAAAGAVMKPMAAIDMVALYFAHFGWSTVEDVLAQIPGVKRATIVVAIGRLMDMGVLRRRKRITWRDGRPAYEYAAVR